MPCSSYCSWSKARRLLSVMVLPDKSFSLVPSSSQQTVMWRFASVFIFICMLLRRSLTLRLASNIGRSSYINLPRARTAGMSHDSQHSVCIFNDLQRSSTFIKDSEFSMEGRLRANSRLLLSEERSQMKQSSEQQLTPPSQQWNASLFILSIHDEVIVRRLRELAVDKK